MDHYVVYHNQEAMGFDAGDLDGFGIITAKPVAKAFGGRVWVITGRGEPRRYSLVQTFVAEYAGPHDEHPDLNLVAASSGESFKPEIEIDGFDWFPDFRRSMGNFGLGFQRLKEPRFVEALEKVAAAARRRVQKPTVRRRAH